MAETLGVYIPVASSELSDRIWSGSGIVGSEIDGADRVRIDFEGSAEIYPTFVERVRRAAERHQHRRSNGRQGYPTQACAYVSRTELVQVGTWDAKEGKLTIVSEELLEHWLRGEERDG